MQPNVIIGFRCGKVAAATLSQRRLCRRFLTAIVLRRVVEEKALDDVVDEFKAFALTKGDIQALQEKGTISARGFMV